MKIIMIAAVSKDGFITKGSNSDVSEWTSPEDKKFFEDIKSKHKLFVMGSKTYDSGLVIPKPETLKVVLTTNPEKYSSQRVPGQLGFMKLSPQEFISNYKSTHETCLLLGGGYTYTEFLEANLVDEIYLTVEPIVLESGTPLLNNDKSIDDYCRQEHESSTLNSSGTLLQHYVLKK